jgi:hypothetical protein
MNRLLKLIAVLSSLVAALVLSRCGGKGEGVGTCNATHVGNGVTISMTQIAGNSYKITLCNDIQSRNTYTVYGGIGSSSITPSMITTASIRLHPVANARTVGSVYQVEFNSSDTWFAIYLDTNTSQIDTTTLLVSGQITGR